MRAINILKSGSAIFLKLAALALLFAAMTATVPSNLTRIEPSLSYAGGASETQVV
jgi:hypothetical protein